MDNTGDFYSLNMGSIPVRRTKYIPVAQWLEQQTHNLLVTGSSPVLPIVSGWLVFCMSILLPSLKYMRGFFLTSLYLYDILLSRKQNAKRYIELFIR